MLPADRHDAAALDFIRAVTTEPWQDRAGSARTLQIRLALHHECNAFRRYPHAPLFFQEEMLENRIFGKTGHAVIDIMQGDVRIYADGRRWTFRALAVEGRHPHRAPADNLVDVALGRRVNRAPAKGGLATVHFLDAMYRSAAGGGSPVLIEQP
jgi:hypothetical protein